MNTPYKTKARHATLDRIKKTVLPNFIDPIPGDESLRKLFGARRVPKFKPNPTAKRGGGPVYYLVSAVEKG